MVEIEFIYLFIYLIYIYIESKNGLDWKGPLSLKLNFNPFLSNSCHGQRHLPLHQVAQRPQVEAVAFKRTDSGAVPWCIHSQI